MSKLFAGALALALLAPAAAEAAYTPTSVAQTYTAPQTFTGAGSGNNVGPVVLKNTGTGASGSSVEVEMYPDATGFARAQAYRDGADNNAGIDFQTMRAGTINTRLIIDSLGLMHWPAYTTASVLQTDASGNITAPSFAGSIMWLDLNHPTTNFPIISDRNGDGIVSARTQTMLQIVGTPNLGISPEVNVVQAIAYNGYAQYDAERYDRSSMVDNGAVLSGETIGLYSFEPFDGQGDITTAGIAAMVTQDQHCLGVSTNCPGAETHGTGVDIAYTPNSNGASKRCAGMWISEAGLGGIGFGDTNMSGNTGTCSGVGPSDLGNGSLHAWKSIVAGKHFSSDGGAPSGCSATGSDNAGIAIFSATATCTLTFHDAWANTPVCIVQNKNNATPTAYVSALNASSMTITVTSSMTGSVYYICQGVGGV